MGEIDWSCKQPEAVLPSDPPPPPSQELLLGLLGTTIVFVNVAYR